MPRATLLTRIAAIGSATALALVGVAVQPAAAAPAVIQPQPNTSFTADRLPTVQINGVVWSQVVVGNKVYAGGSFTRARPAGAAAGTNETVRNNLLAFDITTGVMDSSFAPDLNGQVLSVTASPDKSRIYVVGDFTTANGQARRRVAAYSTATGALITAFNPVGVSSQARAVIATNDTVYVGGGFGQAGSNTRRNLAAFRASDGALLPWAPSTDLKIWGLATDGNSVFAAGQFTTVNSQPAYGLAKIDGVSGTLDTAWQPEVRNAGPDAAVGSIALMGGKLYGTTWHFGPGGNLEGSFKVGTGGTGSVEWVTDCHGDNYSAFLSQGTVYTVGHAHYCGNMGGGFPQYSSWKFQHAQAWSDTVTGDILNDVHFYDNWHGVKPGPAMINWLPDFAMGSYTGQYQAGWTITGTDDYLVIGGEFPRVNSTGQQGLVRFAKRPIAPGAEGPKFVGNKFVPSAVAQSTTEVRITWPPGYDRDDRTLTYKLYRGGTLINTQTADSNWWTLPALGYLDTGRTPGASYTYRVVASDAGGNTVNSSSTSVALPTSFAATNPYAQAVKDAGAKLYWPLNDTRSGSPMAIRDWAGFDDGVADNDVTAGQPGAIPGDAAVTVGTAEPNQPWARIYSTGSQLAPNTFTTQVWVKTTTTRGGRIFGFGDLQAGNSGHRDRHIWMSNSGQISFGVRATDNSNRVLTSSKSYNDDQWHMITASMGSDGMALYIDGVRVAKRSDTTEGEQYLGFWRVQGDNTDGWPTNAATSNFVGSVDEIAVYPTVLDQNTILAQYAASGRTAAVPQAPADGYGAAVYADDPDLYWRFNETSGVTAADSGRAVSNGTYRSGVTLGANGVVSGNLAAQFDGANDVVTSNAQFSNPTAYSMEAWFNTTTNAGGKIIGFGNAQTGDSNNYDRHVYMLGDGRVVFGVWTGQTNTIETTAAFNDGQWHHVVASQDGDGMKLYIDGELQGTNPQTAAQNYDGFWRVGGDTSWGGAPYFNGVIDEAAVYSYGLSQERVRAHYTAAGGVLNQAPTAEFSSTVAERRVSFSGSGSDPDGTVVGYAWDFGDGATGSGQDPVHVYPASGTYTATLTVTDNKGATGSVSHQVVVAASPGPNDAYGAAVHADSPRIYWRLGESSGTVAADAGGALSNGAIVGGPALGRPGAIDNPNTAIGFNEAGGGQYVTSDDAFVNPTVYSEEAWFRTTTGGGKIMGFGCSQASPSNCYDRHIYLRTDGQLAFGTYTGQMNIIATSSPVPYTDGQWHHVVATQSAAGMKLYVDGALVGTDPQTSAEAYTGWLHVGGDNTWDNSGVWFNGEIDEVALYLHELSPSRVLAHYQASQPTPNQPPVAAFTATPDNLKVSVDASASSDPDGSVVSYAWDFGDGATATGVTAEHTYGTAGTRTITLVVTDDDGATSTTTESVTVEPANVNPVASFTATPNLLQVSVDGSASSDPDGSIVGYQWDFGDDATGSGVTAQHSYATAGTYTITLTVTDNRGGTHSTTREVTVAGPPNVAPQAGFTVTVTDLTASFDGTSSMDPDGTITDYAWDFGDDQTGSGATPTHAYGSAGSYSVTLTVTDNGGATNSKTVVVTVTEPAEPTLLASDAFNRVVNNGWGVADVGGPWSASGSASNFAVADGVGTIRMATGSGPGIYQNGVNARDVDLRSTVSYDKPGEGGGMYTSFIVRRNGSTDYRAMVRVTSTVVNLQLLRKVDGTSTMLATANLAGGALPADAKLNVRLQAVGTGLTTLRVKVWRDGETEPTSWQLSVMDATASLQGSGSVGLYSYLSGSATNSPVVARFSEWSVEPA